jgi:hypothetical protein
VTHHKISFFGMATIFAVTAIPSADHDFGILHKVGTVPQKLQCASVAYLWKYLRTLSWPISCRKKAEETLLCV